MVFLIVLNRNMFSWSQARDFEQNFSDYFQKVEISHNIARFNSWSVTPTPIPTLKFGLFCQWFVFLILYLIALVWLHFHWTSSRERGVGLAKKLQKCIVDLLKQFVDALKVLFFTTFHPKQHIVILSVTASIIEEKVMIFVHIVQLGGALV